ncbi:MAG: hypothetical protein J6T74_03105 [Clostridia bacterium]|nr:hypothetical protein [Clostridia bacterium]
MDKEDLVEKIKFIGNNTMYSFTLLHEPWNYLSVDKNILNLFFCKFGIDYAKEYINKHKGTFYHPLCQGDFEREYEKAGIFRTNTFIVNNFDKALCFCVFATEFLNINDNKNIKKFNIVKNTELFDKIMSLLSQDGTFKNLTGLLDYIYSNITKEYIYISDELNLLYDYAEDFVRENTKEQLVKEIETIYKSIRIRKTKNKNNTNDELYR